MYQEDTEEAVGASHSKVHAGYDDDSPESRVRSIAVFLQESLDGRYVDIGSGYAVINIRDDGEILGSENNYCKYMLMHHLLNCKSSIQASSKRKNTTVLQILLGLSVIKRIEDIEKPRLFRALRPPITLDVRRVNIKQNMLKLKQIVRQRF